jgi:hypothetical protein
LNRRVASLVRLGLTRSTNSASVISRIVPERWAGRAGLCLALGCVLSAPP